MADTILLVNHLTSKRDDRVSRLVAELGYKMRWYCPGEGDPLPEPGPEHVGAVVYGGVESANDAESKPYIRQEIDWIDRWVASGKSFLGLCLGGQLLARCLGARVAPHPQGLFEIGYVRIEPTPAGLDFLPEPLHVYHWHKEGFEVPEGAELLAKGPTFPNQAFRYGENAYALQFHPEVTIPVMTRWIGEAGHMLSHPGAHPPERQLADAGHFDRPLGEWMEDFLERWLDGHREVIAP